MKMLTILFSKYMYYSVVVMVTSVVVMVTSIVVKVTKSKTSLRIKKDLEALGYKVLTPPVQDQEGPGSTGLQSTEQHPKQTQPRARPQQDCLLYQELQSVCVLYQ